MKTKTIIFFTIVTLFMTGVMGTRLIIPLITNEYGASAGEIGVIVSIYSLLPLILSIKIGRSLDKIGTKIPFLISVSIGALGLVIPFITQNMTGIYLSQVITGISHTAFVIAGQRYAGLMTSSQKRNGAIAQFTIGVSIGSFLGPMIGGFISDLYGFEAAFGILGLISLSSFLLIPVLANIKKKRKAKENVAKTSIKSLLKVQQFRTAVIISSIIILAREVFITYFPLMASELGYSASIIGSIVSVNLIALIVIRLFMEKLLNRFSTSVVIRVSIVVTAATFLLLPFVDGVAFFYLISIILGLSFGIGQPLSIAMTVDALSKDRVGEGLGVRITFNRLTQLIVPATFGGVALIGGFIGIFCLASVMIVGSAFTIKEEEKEEEIRNVHIQ